MSIGQKVQKWDQLDPNLKSFAHMAVAALIGCSWCLDFNYFQAHNEGLDETKASEVPRWRESSVFTSLERDVMEYAEAMSETPPRVTDELSARLLEQLGAPAMVELRLVGRVRQHVDAEQRGARDRVAGILQGVRRAAGATSEPVRDVRMTEDAFTRHRSLLFTVAYEMLGSASDAEDVVQETWLRWSKVDQSQVLDHRAYLVRIVTRQALNRLRSLSRRREEYVGEWLRNRWPLAPTSPPTSSSPTASRSRCSPCSRRSHRPSAPCSCCARCSTSHTTRSRKRSTRHRPPSARSPTGPASTSPRAEPRVPVSTAEQQEVVDRFLAAVRGGDLQGLLDVLAPDVVMIADGGGLVTAARRPVLGAERTAGFLLGAGRLTDFQATPAWFNGAAGARIDIGGQLDTAVSLTVEDGRITRIYAIRNPHKLSGLRGIAVLTRS